ncbi:NAD(P)/FAD-dependent oxidoreductase [Mesorhizobium sp. A623]
MVPGKVDVAVIGGGIIGCATAWRLAEKGISVSVFERGTIASEQSSRAWGFIRQQGRNEAELPLAAEANRLWTELTERFGNKSIQFVRGGILVPAESESDVDRVVKGHETARAFGLDTRLLDSNEVKALLPEMSGAWRAGLFTAGDAHADPELSTQTIARAARIAGAAIFENTLITSVEPAARAWRVNTLHGNVEASTIVLANGISAPFLARSLGYRLPIQIVKSSVGKTFTAAPFTSVAVWGPKVAFRPSPNGSFTLGNGYRGMGVDYEITIDSFRELKHFLPAYRNNWRQLSLSLGKDFIHQIKARLSDATAAGAMPEPTPNRRKVLRNLSCFRRLFPHLGLIELETMWAGRLDMTPDVIPIIDRPDGDRNMFIAAGFSGHGFALGPSIGKQLAEWITEGRPSLDLSPFRLARFKDGIVGKSHQSL